MSSNDSLSGLSRDDEKRLHWLREKQQAAAGQTTPSNGSVTESTAAAALQSPAPLSQDEELELSLLEDRYNFFLEEGVRKLRESTTATSSQAHSPHGHDERPHLLTDQQDVERRAQRQQPPAAIPDSTERQHLQALELGDGEPHCRCAAPRGKGSQPD